MDHYIIKEILAYLVQCNDCKKYEKQHYSMNICCICKELNKIIEIQLKNLKFDDNNKKMKKIIVNNSDILKHIYYKDNILNILELNTKIVNDLLENTSM